jgi:cysteinyl-tRNA synthetase
MMQAHYRSVLDFSNDAMLASEKGYNRLMEALDSLTSIKASATSTLDIQALRGKCYEAMNDDFNTPVLIANLFEGVKWINLLKEDKASLNEKDLSLLKDIMKDFVYDILALDNVQETNQNSHKLDAVVSMLIKMREEARGNRNWALSDQIRDELLEIGIQLKDGKEGTTFTIQ